MNTERISSPTLPLWCNHVDDILDTSNYLFGDMNYSEGYGATIVKAHGGLNLLIKNLKEGDCFHWTTATRPTSPHPGVMGYNTTTSKTECWDGSTWNNLW